MWQEELFVGLLTGSFHLYKTFILDNPRNQLRNTKKSGFFWLFSWSEILSSQMPPKLNAFAKIIFYCFLGEKTINFGVFGFSFVPI